MAKKNSMDLESLCGGILFCISLVALIIACLAYTKKNQGGEYYCASALAADGDGEERKKRLKKRRDDSDN